MRSNDARERTAAFFDECGEREWTRFEDGQTPAQSLDVHLKHLRRNDRAGQRALEVGAGPGRSTIELAPEPEPRAFVSWVEREPAAQPGALTCGQHLLVVLRTP